MTNNLNPVQTTNEMHEKYESQGLLRKWKDYLDAAKNTTLRTSIYERQNHICPRCGKPIASIGVGSVAHHISYDNVCSFQGEKITQPVPTHCNPYRTRRLCDCKKCSVENKEGFEKCKNNIVLLHRSCHAVIHNKLA